MIINFIHFIDFGYYYLYKSIDPNAIDIGNMLQKPSAEHLFGTDELGRDYFIRVLNGAKISLIVGVSIDPNAIDIGNMLQKPSAEHLFGTDELGRDYFIRVLNGAKISLIVGVLAMATSVVIGVTLGIISGYFGGLVDSIIMRTVDVFCLSLIVGVLAMATSVVIGVTLGIISGYFGGLVDSIIMRTVDVFCSVPWIIMVTVVSLIFKKGLFSIILVIGLFSWMEIARLVRSETMSAKNREYVQYAELIGVPKWTIMTKHILPSIYPLIITSATSAIANAIMVESAMSFLGIGIQAPMASWGSLLQTAQTNLAKAPYMAFIPGILIVLTICSFNKLGDLLRIYVEPRISQEEE